MYYVHTYVCLHYVCTKQAFRRRRFAHLAKQPLERLLPEVWIPHIVLEGAHLGQQAREEAHDRALCPLTLYHPGQEPEGHA